MPQSAVVALAPHTWDDRWLSRQHLLSRLGGQGWRVVYSWGMWHAWQAGCPAWRAAPWRSGLQEQDGVLVDQPGRLLLRRAGWPRWDRWVVARHAARLRAAAGTGPLTAVLFHPVFWPYVAALQPDRVAYHVYDVFQGMDDWSPALEAMQQALVARADLITVASPGMAAALPGAGPAKARLLPNGADAPAFARARGAPLPPLLAAIPAPRIGYVGTINSKLDLDMVATLASRQPDWQWVFVGPVLFNEARERDRLALRAWRQCLALPNFHHLPNQPRALTPALAANMQVNIICYRIRDDDWVVHGYPVKLHEYLATGQPVVAAPQTVIQIHFADVVAIAVTPEEWQQALQQALDGSGVGSPAARQAVALDNTWDARAAQWAAWLQAL